MKILFTGGLGDFITVESFMNNNEKDNVKEIALATRSLTPVRKLIESYPIFPHLQQITIFFDNWSNIGLTVLLIYSPIKLN